MVEKHGGKTRRSWRKLHLATAADTGRIVASALTTNDADDGPRIGPLLDRHIGAVVERGRMGWRRAPGANQRDLVEADIARFERVIGDGLRCGRTAAERPRSPSPRKL